MQGFKLNNGDVVIENGEIQMTAGGDLLRQTVETVLNTNKGEWWLNPDEGITFSNILGKHTTAQQDTDTSVFASGSSDTANELLAKRLDGVI